MSTVLIPAVEGLCPDQVADSPFHRLVSLSRRDLAATRGLPTALGNTEEEWLLQCFDSLAQSLMAYGLLLTHSTFPGDSADSLLKSPINPSRHCTPPSCR